MNTEMKKEMQNSTSGLFGNLIPGCGLFLIFSLVLSPVLSMGQTRPTKLPTKLPPKISTPASASNSEAGSSTPSDNHGGSNSHNSFISATDQDLTMKSITLATVTDNVNGIYAKPLQAELIRLLNADLQWSLIEYPTNLNIRTDQLDDNPTNVRKILGATKADAVLVANLTKGSRGINGTLTLFQGREGLPLAQESLVDFKGFDIADTNAEFARLFTQLKAKIPYKGLIMSRRGQQVTINLGSNYGLRPQMNVSIVQVIQINRHPKLKFMVSNEKEVLGRVQLEKVEPSLSFGSITFEREPGVVTVGSKVLPEDFVKYSTPTMTPDGKILPDLNARQDKTVSFGESPQEWLPEAPPQYGKVDVLAGISSYEQSTTLNGSGSIAGSNSLAPNIAVRGELWLNSTWFMGFNLRQSVFSISNSLPNSNPGSLNMAMSQYGVSGGYNFLLSNDFFGPKMQVHGGFTNTKFSVDKSSPLAFTTTEYGDLMLGLAGQFPISPELPVDLGANFNLWLNPSLSESTSSGSSSNSVNSFGFFMDYRLKQKLKVKTEIDFEYYNSTLSGSGPRLPAATSTSHKLTTLLVGLEYLF